MNSWAALIQQAPQKEARKTFPQVSDYSSEAGNEKLAEEIDFLLLWCASVTYGAFRSPPNGLTNNSEAAHLPWRI